MPAPGVINRKTYDKAVEAFTIAPGNYNHCARYVGINPKTARRLWLHGWPQWQWAPPIKDVYKEREDRSLAAVSAKLQAEAREAEQRRESASNARTEEKLEEQRIVKAARQNVLGLLGLSAELYPSMRAYVSKIRAETLDANGKPKPPDQIKASPEQAMKMVAYTARLLERTSQVMDRVLEAGRTDRGEASEILSVSISRELSPEEAAVEIEEQDAALEIIRMRAREAKRAPIDDGLEDDDVHADDVHGRGKVH